jgi:hypothetical protein
LVLTLNIILAAAGRVVAQEAKPSVKSGTQGPTAHQIPANLQKDDRYRIGYQN